MEKPRIGCGVSFVLRLVMVFSAVIFARCQNNNDAQVMDALKKAIKFTNATFWSDSDFCKWEFVKCNGAKVTRIQIDNQGLTGTLPKELENLTELEDLECMHNNLSGPFPNLASSLQTLFINDNSFSLLPNDFFSGKTTLGKVDIGNNPFPPWQIPGSLKDCISLTSFAATRVNFVGKIPEFLGKDGPLPSLTNLSMSFNSLEGELPASFSGSSIELLWLNGQKGNSKLNGTLAVLQNMTSLKQVWLHGNSFTGPIPVFTKHGQLYDVSIRDNQLTGIVPPSLVNLKSLKIVNLTNNYLQGPMPRFPAGVNVDMIGSNNKFCTNEPGQPCSRPVNDLLSVVEPLGYPLQFAKDWEGNDPCSRPWPHITCVNGNISVINFSNLKLTGTISPSYANLNSVTELLLQNNNLTGTIPSELTSMPLLEKLDVSNNQLHGAVPSFRVDVVLNLTGNPAIGKDKPSPTPGSPGLDSGSNNGTKKSRTGVIVGTVVGFIVLFCLAVLGFLLFQKKQKNSGKFQRPVMVVDPHRSTDDLKITVAGRAASGGRTDVFSPRSNATADVQAVGAGSMAISIQVLREVTNNFSEENILGKGGFGTVYRGELHDGTKIAVKRMETGMEGEKGLSEFKAEIVVLTRVRHRHLVALLGYCLDGNERLLVYEYMPQGTLSKYLFNWKSEDVKPLEWTRRLIIALDVARGVEYLHGLAQQIFIHRDLKPSNILLGDDMRAKVSDFGLVRLAPEGKASFETRVAGTFGYLAPEYAATGRVTTKVDVYSFGVILMEMITGRKAIDDSRTEENVHLVSWFRRMLLNKDTFNKAIDPVIDAGEETLANITTVAELAGHCTARESYQRPDMSHVVNVLSPLVEAWKPGEPDADDIYGVNLEMSLPQAMKKWQALEGTSTMDMDVSSSSPFLTDRDNTQSSIPNRPSGFAASFSSTDGR